MKKHMKTVVLSLLAGLAIARAVAAADLRIEYSHAGLTKIQVNEQQQLHFQWHTGRLPYKKGDSSPIHQNLDAYDSHSTAIWLTEMEMAGFENWIEKHGIFDLESKYPEPENMTYGSAFHSSLHVELGDKHYSLTWTGDTKIPDSLREAVNRLVEMSHGIRKCREGN